MYSFDINITDEIKALTNDRKFDRSGKTQFKKKKKQDLSEIKDEVLRSEIAKRFNSLIMNLD